MRIKTLITALIMTAISANAQLRDITLPEPTPGNGASLYEALRDRHSTRDFKDTKPLDDQQLSNLLWSAAGINRKSEMKRTNPTALNTQEIDLYVFAKEGVYLYDFENNRLLPKAEGDHRSLVAGTKEFSQDFVLDAPVSIVMVAELSRFGEQATGNERFKLMAAADAGYVSENINLFCSANGLITVPRATMDSAGIVRLLGLPATALPLINNPVGRK